MSNFANRYVALVKETTYGTDPSSGYKYGEVDDESMQHNFDLMTRQDMSRYGSSQSNTGKEYSEGDINMALMADDFTALIVSGIYNTNTNASGTHTFTEAGTDRSFTMKVGRETNEHTYTGVAVDSISLNASMNEYATMSASFMGQSEGALASLATPTFPNGEDALYFSNAKVFFNNHADASTAVKSISVDISVNRDGDNACGLGSDTYVRLPPKQRMEITGTIEFNKIIHTASNDEPTYDNLKSADGFEHSPDGASSDYAIRLQFGDESTADKFTLDLFKVRYEAPSASVSGRDTQTVSVGFVALFDDGGSNPANAMSQITLRNATSSQY
jgi:hypothetical protein